MKQPNTMCADVASRSQDVSVNTNELSNDLLNSQSIMCISRGKETETQESGSRARNRTDYPVLH